MHNFQVGFMQCLTEDGTEMALVELAESQISSADTWNIYRRNYVENHIAALTDTYSGVCDLVGDNYFRQLARYYVQTHRSHSADLNEYGADFPDFLERELLRFPAAERLPYLADMARLDRASFGLMRATRGSADWITQLHTIAPSKWTALKVDAAAVCLQSKFPIYDIWRMQQGESIAIILEQAQSVLLTYQTGLHVLLLGEREAVFLSHWFAGAGLEQALELALTACIDGENGSEELDVLALLNRLARYHAIRRII